MSYILNLTERKTNGSLNNVKRILQDFPEEIFVNKIITNWGFISKFISENLYEINFIDIFLAVGCVISVILIGIIYTIFACRYSRQLIYIEQPIRYRLLSNNEGSTNNLVISESENEDEIR